MHVLFYLEEEYDLIPDEIDGQFCLKLKDRFTTASSNLESWYKYVQDAPPNQLEKSTAHYNQWKQS